MHDRMQESLNVIDEGLRGIVQAAVELRDDPFHK